MNDKEWEKLFDLIEKAINLPGLTAKEKGEEIRSRAKGLYQDVNLEEFIATAADDE